LKDKFDGDIPGNAAEMQTLPGVGPKIAYLAMLAAWKRLGHLLISGVWTPNSRQVLLRVADGIGVDLHVHRICNRLRWADTLKPEDTRLV
jgi:endonuclease-3